MKNSIDLSTLLLLELLKKKQKRHCSPKSCCCCCPCPQPPIPNPCPNPTLPNEPPECETRRQTFAVNSPYFDFGNNLQYYFYNTQATLTEATNLCAMLGASYRFITIQELALINITNGMVPLCPMLVWATVNGTPTLVLVIPSPNPSNNPNLTIPVTTRSSCKGYVFCVTNIE